MVKRKDDDRHLGHLIWFPSAKYMTASNMAHEAVHVSMDLCSLIDCYIDTDNQEPFAYLVGWVTDCMDKVKRIKL